MAKLILSLEGSTIREVQLDKERIMIGRRPSNEIQIENLAVSGEHACIVTILNDSFLEDLGSTNGTLVNGNPIKKHILQHNDVIEIGKYKLKYIVDKPAVGKAAGGNEDFEKTMILRSPAKAAASVVKPANEPAPPPKPSMPPPTPRPLPPAPSMPPPIPRPVAPAPSTPPPTPRPVAPAPSTPQPTPKPVPPAPSMPPPTPRPVPPPAKPAQPAAAPAVAQPLAAVQILTGPSAGKELELIKNLTTLGKPGLQVAVITRRPQGYFITHVEGAKFPGINGKTIDAQAQPLHDHDVIELAGVKMEFYLKK
jgi:predicted component of type VI protein secretion system